MELILLRERPRKESGGHLGSVTSAHSLDGFDLLTTVVKMKHPEQLTET